VTLTTRSCARVLFGIGGACLSNMQVLRSVQAR
jgi:hypothetical protein